MMAARCSVHPSDELRILLLGEGNVSFTYALVKKIAKSPIFGRFPAVARSGATEASPAVVRKSPKLRPAASPPLTSSTAQKCLCRVYTTTFDSESELARKYPESEPFMRYFHDKTRVRVTYAGGVNATDLVHTLPVDDVPNTHFHLVYFNNPHIGIEDQYRHRSLLSHTFGSIRSFNAAMGGDSDVHVSMQQVVIALCDEQPVRWDLLRSAANSGFVCVAAVPMLPSEFPEFTNRRHQSDAAFPFEHMVQYYFVSAEEMCERGSRDDIAWLSALDAVFREFDSSATGHGCSTRAGSSQALIPQGTLTLTDWRDALNTTQVFMEEATNARCSAPTTEDGGFVQYALHAKWQGRLTVPLLHPHLAFYHKSGDDSKTEWYSPYLDLHALPALYRTQLAAERQQHQQRLAADEKAVKDVPAGTADTPIRTEKIPAQLDAQVLGRPLTQREEVKLQRYLAKLSTHHTKTKSNVVDKTGNEEQVEFCCSTCTPARPFTSKQALDAHMRSQHSGVDQLPPTHHARVHKQIVLTETDAAAGDGDGFEEAANITTTDTSTSGLRSTYCTVCRLQFKSTAAYEEHLTFLSPSAVQEQAPAGEGYWLCKLCTPPRPFNDERALLQHHALKHTT